MTAKTVAEGLAAYNTDADLRAARMRMGAALPAEGWLGDYVRAVTPLTDAPVEFHLVSGLCALSAAIGNRLYAVHWGQNVFPHLWAVLVAPSSFWRKSTSISAAEVLLKAAAPNQVYPSDFSREKLLGLLSERPSGMLTLKEFGGFLATLGRDYNAGTKETLTELYDGPNEYIRALQSKVVTINRPALTMLGATTLDWLEGKILEGDLAGGFLPRFLWVTAREKASAKGLTGDMEPGLRVRLTSGLHAISEGAERAITYTPAAKERLDDWMQGWEAEVTGVSHRSDLSGFAVRLQTYAIKLSILYRVSRTYGDDLADHIVDELSVNQAIAYCRLLWTNVVGLIDEKIAITKDAKELRRIATIIGSGTTKSNALKLSKLKARDFDQYLDTLVQGGMVTLAQVRGSEVGLDRAQDRKVTWLSPVPLSPNGHSVPTQFNSVPPTEFPSVQLGSPGTESDGGTKGNRVEPSRTEPSTESPLSSTFSPSLSQSDESGAHTVRDTRARGSEPSPTTTRRRRGKAAEQVEPTTDEGEWSL